MQVTYKLHIKQEVLPVQFVKEDDGLSGLFLFQKFRDPFLFCFPFLFHDIFELIHTALKFRLNKGNKLHIVHLECLKRWLVENLRFINVPEEY